MCLNDLTRIIEAAHIISKSSTHHRYICSHMKMNYIRSHVGLRYVLLFIDPHLFDLLVAMEDLRQGATVIIHGVQSEAGLNGQYGRLNSYNEAMRTLLRRVDRVGATHDAACAYILLGAGGAASPPPLGRGAVGHIHLMRALPLYRCAQHPMDS